MNQQNEIPNQEPIPQNILEQARQRNVDDGEATFARL